MALDPVCGMEVDPFTAEYKAEYMGEVYYFDSALCLDEFEADPEAVLKGGLYTGEEPD